LEASPGKVSRPYLRNKICFKKKKEKKDWRQNSRNEHVHQALGSITITCPKKKISRKFHIIRLDLEMVFLRLFLRA
jgi:hypothetical protein